MNRHLFQLGICILLSGFSVFSQTPAPVPKTQENQAVNKADEENSDLVITATVHARELKFEIVPDPKVEFPGKPERQTVWESDRTNLPEKIEPGVTYRNIGIRLRIYSRFAEIQRIVLEAIDDEPPPADNSQVVPASTSVEKNHAPAAPVSTTQAIKTVKKPVRRSRKK